MKNCPNSVYPASHFGVGIAKAFGPDTPLLVVGEVGSDDNRLRLVRTDDLRFAIETNEDPLFEDDSEAWAEAINRFDELPEN